MSKIGTQWTRVIGGCICCGGDAWALAGLNNPMGNMNVHIRCELCRMHCNQNKRGECRTAAVAG